MIDKALVLLKRPTVLAYLASLVLLLLGLALTYRIRPFTSDDTFWQTILLTGWLPFGHSTVAMGNSSIHVDKLPLYQLFDLIASPSRKVLFVESAVLAVTSFTAFYWSCVYLLKQLTKRTRLSFASLLPFVWVVGLGYAFLSLYLDPDWRSFEISFSFVIFALTYALWRGSLSLQSVRSRVGLVLLALYTGLLIYSDPYILYFALAPLALFTLVVYFPFRKISLRIAVITLLSIIVSVIVSKVFSVIASHAGITIQINYNYVAFVNFSQLGNNLAQTLQSVLVIFGANFFGLSMNSALLAPLLGFVMLSVVIYAIHKVTPRAQKNLNTLWLLFFIIVLLFSLAFYALTNMNLGILTYRYLLFPVLLCVLPFSYFITTLKTNASTYILSGLIIVSIVCNILSLPNMPVDNKANTDNYQVVAMLKSLGYTKGYAGYWDANINSYLSAGSVRVLPSLCSNDKLSPWHWLINDSAFDIKATKSFYINNPNAPWPISVQDNICSGPTLEKQFGQPTKVLTYKQETIYLYNYDITNRL